MIHDRMETSSSLGGVCTISHHSFIYLNENEDSFWHFTITAPKYLFIGFFTNDEIVRVLVVRNLGCVCLNTSHVFLLHNCTLCLVMQDGDAGEWKDSSLFWISAETLDERKSETLTEKA